MINEMQSYIDTSDFKKLRHKFKDIESITFKNQAKSEPHGSKYYSAKNSLVINFKNVAYLIIKHQKDHFVGVLVDSTFDQIGYFDKDIHGNTVSQTIKNGKLPLS